MPDRILRAGCLDSERVDALSEMAENYFKRVLNIVDDYGRFEYDPLIILLRTYPRRMQRYTVQMVEDWTKECTKGEEPLITLYRIGRKRYLQVNQFRQRRRSKSKCPPPPGVIDQLPGASDESTDPIFDGHMSDSGRAAAGLARATNTTSPTHTHTTTHSHIGKEESARETNGTGKQPEALTPEARAERVAIATALAEELHRQHPEPCSLPQTRSAALGALLGVEGVSPSVWAETVRQTYAVHQRQWLAERSKKPAAYVPALHVWFREEMHTQHAAAMPRPPTGADWMKQREERKKAKKEGGVAAGKKSDCA